MIDQDQQYLQAIKRYRIHQFSLEAKRAPEVFERLMNAADCGVWIRAGYYTIDAPGFAGITETSTTW